MATATSDWVGRGIKIGQSGNRPKITAVLWRGTAEVSVWGCQRVPAAWVDTTWGRMAVVELAGCPATGPELWDARIPTSREWETAGGELIAEEAPGLSATIDAYLAGAEARHEQACRVLNDRCARGTYPERPGGSAGVDPGRGVVP